MAPAPIPAGLGETMVWTGREVIVCCAIANPTAPGRAAAYDPAANGWREIAAPPPISYGTGYWTGRVVLLIGFDQSAPGGTALVSYDPATDSWRTLAPPPSGTEQTAVWTGSELIALRYSEQRSGGFDTVAYLPGSNQWGGLAPAPAGVYATGHAVWTGREMVVWGGEVPSGGSAGPAAFATTGGAYDPGRNRWRLIAPSPRIDETILPPQGTANVGWAGGRVVEMSQVVSTEPQPGHAVVYDPVANRWRVGANAPFAGRLGTTTASMGAAVVAVGGVGVVRNDFVSYADVSVYDPATDRWSGPLNAPLLGRQEPLVIWTGHDLIVWGGGVGNPHPGFRQDGAVMTPEN
jgi:hypothetical protein